MAEWAEMWYVMEDKEGGMIWRIGRYLGITTMWLVLWLSLPLLWPGDNGFWLGTLCGLIGFGYLLLAPPVALVRHLLAGRRRSGSEGVY